MRPLSQRDEPSFEFNLERRSRYCTTDKTFCDSEFIELKMSLQSFLAVLSRSKGPVMASNVFFVEKEVLSDLLQVKESESNNDSLTAISCFKERALDDEASPSLETGKALVKKRKVSRVPLGILVDL